jgi:hypothetical protein
MNPNWLPVALTGIGLLINLIWTAVNMQMRADLARQIADLKESMRREYVTTEICELRMAKAA